ncbi:DUF2157 domain-containing protein [Daejeonella lutea]|uniref:Predicted membrane protein n=1 Tax=Daejeonella lutea TaxID=572036 RepID=A0A1T5F896_9SPHI|nr:DUF2157 domain-containing protein [Daejeonella lutea]SKB92371.1 Predicted membrane protein [Daejeonella lutea]
MVNPIFEDLHAQGLISDKSLENIQKKELGAFFSIHWELKTFLYLGVMMLSTGLGILVYKNIDSISHQAVLGAIGLICIACFAWCYKNKSPFSPEKVESPSSLFDYILLLGTLSFLSFIGYMQFQYEVFGTRYGMATFIPMVFLFWTAYYFDHLGILTMAIANLAIWMGISVTPKNLLRSGDFSNERALYTYLALGLFLLILAYFSRSYNFKKHFSFSYHNYGVHLAFIAIISGYFYYDYLYSLIWLAIFGMLAWFLYQNSFKQRSFYFLMITVLYSYVAISGFALRSLFFMDKSISLLLAFLYLIGSGFCLVVILMDLNKKLKSG